MHFRSFYVGDRTVIISRIWRAEKEGDRVLVRPAHFDEGMAFLAIRYGPPRKRPHSEKLIPNTPVSGSVCQSGDPVFRRYGFVVHAQIKNAKKPPVL